MVDPVILDNWAQRSLNWPFTHSKTHTNFCGYPRDPITNYGGCFSSGRALITYAFFFKYMLDNGLDKADGLASDVVIRSELFGVETAPEETKATIKDFATEYVKILDIWANTTGTIDMLKGEDYSGGDWNVENAHYVPSTTTIKVGDKTYNTADMLETALRSYLLVRGYDGNYTASYGPGSHPALTGGAVTMSETEVPVTHDYKWGANPYNETSGNGGHFVMGTKDDNRPSKAKVDVLDNWAMRSLNWPITKGAISNLCGYKDNQLEGYYGGFSAMRGLITYAFFFKYMLDNKLEKADEITADVVIRSELFGDENPFASNVAYKKGSCCYDDGIATVNDYAFTPTLKLGTSSKYGDVTVTLPAGTKAVNFYAVAWKKQPASLKATAGSNEFTFDLKANDGATGNAPYTITVTDDNKYTLDLGAALTADVEVKVETYAGTNTNQRAVIFGVQPVK